MVKLAELHNGETLEFPDETPDDIMDASVQAHLAPPKEDPVVEEEPLPPAPHPLEAGLQQTAETIQEVMGVLRTELAENSNLQAEAITQAAKTTAEASHNASADLAIQLENVATLLGEMAGRSDSLVEAVKALTESINKAATGIIRTMLTPVKVATDTHNNVTSLRRG